MRAVPNINEVWFLERPPPALGTFRKRKTPVCSGRARGSSCGNSRIITTGRKPCIQNEPTAQMRGTSLVRRMC